MALPHFRIIWDKLLTSPKTSNFFKETEQKATSTILDKSVELQRKITGTASIDGPSGTTIRNYLQNIILNCQLLVSIFQF